MVVRVHLPQPFYWMNSMDTKICTKCGHKLRFNRIVYGVGINDAEYVVNATDGSERCKYYTAWSGMIRRAYSSYAKCYVGVTVCEEWKTFSVFREWMKTQDWEGKELDKDLIYPGNKIYGPDRCVFIPGPLNRLFGMKRRRADNLPIGVVFDKSRDKFHAKITVNSKQIMLGRHDTVEKAHSAYLTAKIGAFADAIVEQTDERIIQGLCRHIKVLESDLSKALSASGQSRYTHG